MTRALLLALLVGLAALPYAAQAEAPADLVLAEVRPSNTTDLVERGLDLWEANVDRAIALLSADEAVALESAGYRLTELRRYSTARRAHAAVFGPGSYRGYAAILAELQSVANAYPTLVTLQDLGPTYEGRRIRGARVTSSTQPGPKPVAIFLSAYHAREVATPELALRALHLFVDDYGRDPLLTRLVDTREIWIVPLVNADGHARVEGGAEWWRKTANPTSACGANPGTGSNVRHPGVDLNRNHAYAWNAGGGASTDPCAETYQGPTAVSEPETQAIQSLIASASPNVLLSWHQYGNVVLWPPTSRTDGPTSPILTNLGSRLSTLTGYGGGPGAATLYATTGELTEWAWNTRNAAAFTIEVGGFLDDPTNPFAPQYRLVDRYWAENRAAVAYMAQVADNPGRAAAPLVQSVTASAPLGSPTIAVSATLLSGADGPASAAELFIDSLGAEGTGLPGVLSASGATASWSVPTVGLTPGRHTLWMRARAAAIWSPAYAVSVLVSQARFAFPVLPLAGGL